MEPGASLPRDTAGGWQVRRVVDRGLRLGRMPSLAQEIMEYLAVGETTAPVPPPDLLSVRYEVVGLVSPTTLKRKLDARARLATQGDLIKRLTGATVGTDEDAVMGVCLCSLGRGQPWIEQRK